MLRRTVCLKLDVPDDRRDDLHETTDRFRQAAQIAVDRAFERNDDGYVITHKTKLHHLTYEQVREATDGLNTNLVQAARNLAGDAAKGVVSRWENGKRASKPEFTAPTVVYNKKALTYREDGVSLATVNGRVECDFVLPPEGENPQTEYLRGDEWELREGTLHYRSESGEYYLHTTVAKDEDVSEEAENGTVLGVDVGVENIAATSTGRFWSSGLLNHRREQYESVRAGLQQTGTESAHRTIQQLGEREQRWADDLLHRISKDIVSEAVEHDCSRIAFEDLTDIRERMPGAKKFHAWAFRRLFDLVSYKADERGIRTVQVDPAYTSQRCSKCGHTARNNRPSQAEFRCGRCGYENHADYNAAKNVAMKHVRAGQKSPRGRANRHLALKTGTLNGNGEFSPADA